MGQRNPGVDRALRGGLEAEGFAVDTAGNGPDGLWLARENPYDVLVLDIMLPGLSGYDLRTMLRAERNWTPILMLTARMASGTRSTAWTPVRTTT